LYDIFNTSPVDFGPQIFPRRTYVKKIHAVNDILENDATKIYTQACAVAS